MFATRVKNEAMTEMTSLNKLSGEIRRRCNRVGHTPRKERSDHSRVAIEWWPEDRRNTG